MDQMTADVHQRVAAAQLGDDVAVPDLVEQRLAGHAGLLAGLGRYLRIVPVADRLEPARRLAPLGSLRHCDMDHHGVGSRTMPIARVRRASPRVAMPDSPHPLALAVVPPPPPPPVAKLAN